MKQSGIKPKSKLHPGNRSDCCKQQSSENSSIYKPEIPHQVQEAKHAEEHNETVRIYSRYLMKTIHKYYFKLLTKQPRDIFIDQQKSCKIVTGKGKTGLDFG